MQFRAHTLVGLFVWGLSGLTLALPAAAQQEQLSPLGQQWQMGLSGRRLVYENTLAGGDLFIQSRETVDFCANGLFRYSEGDAALIGGPMSSDNQSTSAQDGRWLIAEQQGHVVLVLHFNSGEQLQVAVSTDDGSHVFAEGRAWRVENSPLCGG